jgi:hypothetical protein
VLVAQRPAERPDAVMIIGALAVLIPLTVARQLLWNGYVRALNGRLETIVPAALMIWCALLGAALYYLPEGLRWRHFALMLVTLTVLVQRTPALRLSVQHAKQRYYLALGGAWLGTAILANLTQLSPLSVGGWLFLGAVALTMGQCLYPRLFPPRRAAAA